MRHFFRSCIVLFLFSCGSYLSAQTTPILPYFEGFEDTSMDATWTLVNGASTNKWFFGTAECASGKRGLYVTGTNGRNANYQNSATGVGVWKEFTLPGDPNTDNYYISFDWKQGGEAAADGTPLDSLYVFWVNDSKVTITATAGEIPIALTMHRKTLVNTEFMQGPEFWHNSTIKVKAGTGRLVFYWINNSKDSYPPAACIDNIQISAEKAACQKPSNLETTQDGGVKLTWDGNSDRYEVRYKDETTDKWTEVGSNITEKTYTVTGLSKGIYTFWVRGFCGTDSTAWTSYSNHLLAVSMDKCVNFADLKNSKVVTPMYGLYGERGQAPRYGLVDYGYLNPKSQHTIHYRQDEYDRLSGYNIKTVPKGEIASVRLGTYEGDGGAESLTYTFTIDPANPVLIVKYAALMENLNHTGTDGNNQPRFILRVTDMRDVPLDEVCLSVSFLAGRLPNWNDLPGGPANYPIIWKDWTTMGINMENFVGRQVKLYMETGDCYPDAFPGHACRAYAYFTLDCAPSRLEGLTCGSPTETMDTLWAPPGFRYQWYKASDPNRILYDTRYFVPQSGDTATYECKVSFVEPGKESCGFTLTAALLPRQPVADFEYIACRREIQFYDKSYVQTINGKINEKCDIYWDFGDSISYDRNPVYEFPAPGDYPVTLYASIDGGECDSVWTQTITVTNDTITTILRDSMCYKDRYVFGKRQLIKGGIYSDTLMTNYGCDSISILDLYVHEPFNYDTICGGESYTFEGEVLTLPEGLHELTYKNVISVTGCDSIMMLFVATTAQTESQAEVCADEEFIQFRLVEGFAEEVTFEFDPASLAAGFEQNTRVPVATNKTFRLPLPENVHAGVCSGKLIFHSSYCGDSNSDFSFIINYPGAIIAQRWDDILGILNKDNNGGNYEFVAFQWYRNGERLEGETKSYLFVPEKLNPADRYSAELTRMPDNLTIFTCEFTPKEGNGIIKLSSNQVQSKEKVTLYSTEKGMARIYGMTGVLMGEYDLVKGDNHLLVTLQAGYYLMQVVTDQEERTYYLHITQ